MPMAASIASSASGCSRSAVTQAAIGSSGRSGNAASRRAAASTCPECDSGVSLLTTMRLTTKRCWRGHLGQIAEQVRLAGAEPAGHADAGGPGSGARRRGIGPAGRQRRLEGMLDAGLFGAHLADGGPVGHAGPQRLDRHAGFKRHAASHTSGAIGFCRSPGRTSGHTRICSAAYCAERAARIAGRQRRVGENRHEQAGQMLGIVDDLPQHLVGVHHRGRGIAQHVRGGLGAGELSHVQHHEQPDDTGLAQEMAQRNQHGARIGPGDANRDAGGAQRRRRHLLAAQPLRRRSGACPGRSASSRDRQSDNTAARKSCASRRSSHTSAVSH